MAARGPQSKRDPLDTLTFRSTKRSRDMFLTMRDAPVLADDASHAVGLGAKIVAEYGAVRHLPPPKALAPKAPKSGAPGQAVQVGVQKAASKLAGGSATAGSGAAAAPSNQLAIRQADATPNAQALAMRRAPTMPKPKWHQHWQLYRVISGHQGWVRAVTVEPGNEWFATGSGDRTIKIWDLATCTLKLSLTGHISTVRGLAVSPRHPYLFSVGEDKTVKCWDLEQNKVIRHYHGHLSAVYTCALHPTLDVLMTAGRDATIRVSASAVTTPLVIPGLPLAAPPCGVRHPPSPGTRPAPATRVPGPSPSWVPGPWRLRQRRAPWETWLCHGYPRRYGAVRCRRLRD